MTPSVKETHFQFPGQTGFYRGKVRDVYFFEDKLLMVATDRISAFDVILPRAIPGKGQILNQIAARFLQMTSDIVPNWLEACPDPAVSVGKKCEALAVEMVVRGYLAGHAWREYRDGKRSLCGVSLPEGLRENDRLPAPIITPTTKAHEGHDLDISREEILAQGIVKPHIYKQMEDFTYALFEAGSEYAQSKNLILVDTKYEFGLHGGKVCLIDEVHTPDSSRYFYKEGYHERQEKGETQKQLSKEFVRQWLIENGFQGKDGQKVPEMTDEIVLHISQRYQELYEKVTGEAFLPASSESQNPLIRIEQNILSYFS
ncbi:MAG: phosphoribosylaminoimidazolesuccinocarboxamide synthase [Cyclobacteriaceae bacterium]|nr:phosphoribosylaminoimidazolesuccinocarboxamide synthase [Cyclobacteriaceae bacterium]